MIVSRHFLEEYVRVIGGFAFKSKDFSDKGCPVIRMCNIGGGTVDIKGAIRIPLTKVEGKQKYQVFPDDILMGLSGSIGKIGIMPLHITEPVYLNQRIARFEILDDTKINRDFLHHYLMSELFQRKISQMAVGVAQVNISPKQLESFEIPLPPLEEQKRIATILDKADALRQKRQQAIAKLDELLQSVFLDMFGDPVTNPKGWDFGVLGEVIYSAKDGPHVSPSYSENGIPFLSTRNISLGEVIWEDLKFIDLEEAEQHWKKCKPVKGDILYSKGGTTGIATHIDFDQPIAVWVHVALLKLRKNKVDPKWLEAMLNTNYCYVQSQRYTHGIANKDLGLTRMVKIKLYIPPIEEQLRFSKFYDCLKIEKSDFQASLERINTLFSSLQQRAFNGEL